MKTLTLKDTDIKEVLSGNQCATLLNNLADDYSIDEIISLVDVNNDTFGHAVINEIIAKRFNQLSEDDKAGLPMQGSLKSHNDNDVVKVIKFSLLDESVTIDNIEPESTEKLTHAKLFTDGGSRGNPGPSASGAVILDMDDRVVETIGSFLGITTNNQAEYKAVLLGLETAKKMGVSHLYCYMDSLLIVNQMSGKYKIKSQDLLPIYAKIKELSKKFDHISFTHVPRALNKLADSKVNQILDANQ